MLIFKLLSFFYKLDYSFEKTLQRYGITWNYVKEVNHCLFFYAKWVKQLKKREFVVKKTKRKPLSENNSIFAAVF